MHIYIYIHMIMYTYFYIRLLCLIAALISVRAVPSKPRPTDPPEVIRYRELRWPCAEIDVLKTSSRAMV